MMGSGNFVEEMFDQDQEFHREGEECPECGGTGHVPWADLDDGFTLLKEEIAYGIFVFEKRFGGMNFRQRLKMAKDTRKNGSECQKCAGSGVV